MNRAKQSGCEGQCKISISAGARQVWSVILAKLHFTTSAQESRVSQYSQPLLYQICFVLSSLPDAGPIHSVNTPCSMNEYVYAAFQMLLRQLIRPPYFVKHYSGFTLSSVKFLLIPFKATHILSSSTGQGYNPVDLPRGRVLTFLPHPRRLTHASIRAEAHTLQS